MIKHKEWKELDDVHLVHLLHEKIDKLQSALDVAVEGLETIYVGVDPRDGEWSEQFQDTMLKAFTAKTASDYANEILNKIKQIKER